MKNSYNARLVRRAERLDTLERMDNIIKFLAMSDEKKDKIKELRNNSYRYTSEQLREKTFYILDN